MPSKLLSRPSTGIAVPDLRGVQQPRVHSSPPYARTLGREVVDFMAQVGKPLDEWQALMVLDTFGLRDDGYWSAFECVGLVPRQNGKGGYTEAVELGGLFLFKDQLIMHSAHLFKTAKQSFQRVMDIIDGSDWLTKRVQKVTRARGDEEIELTKRAGGGRLMYFSRSGGSGRGFTGDKTVFDECAYLTVEQYQAATPTLATVPNPQIIYTGTPPDEDIGPIPDDAMMPSVRERGHAGGDRIALWEWSPPKGFNRRDPAVWAMCNPSLGERIQSWFLAKQLENFAAAGRPEKFDTEHLGVWPGFGAQRWQVISEQDWLDASDPDSERPSPVAFAVAVSAERDWATIAQAGPRGDGLQLVSIVDRREGTGWVLPRLRDLRDRWSPVAIVVDKGSPASSLAAELEESGFVLTPINARQVQAAAMAFFDGIAGQRSRDPESGELGPDPRIVRHGNQSALNDAVAAAGKRGGLSGAWLWDDPDGALTAVSNALWGFRTRPPVEQVQPFFIAVR